MESQIIKIFIDEPYIKPVPVVGEFMARPIALSADEKYLLLEFVEPINDDIIFVVACESNLNTLSSFKHIGVKINVRILSTDEEKNQKAPETFGAGLWRGGFASEAVIMRIS